MFTKIIPVTLLVLAAVVTTGRAPWAVAVPTTGNAAHGQVAPVKLNANGATPRATPATSPVAVDDYSMHIEEGVTVNAYALVPLVEHDAVRTQSMIDGIAGRRSTRAATVVADVGEAKATNLLPRAETAALWLAGLMAVLLMALRRRG
jgi:hypothetical protein